MSSVTNDSGLMHVSAALGTPTVAIFGPTSPWHWKPLNPVAAILEPEDEPQARQRARIEGNDAVAHHRTADVSVERVLAAVRKVLAERRPLTDAAALAVLSTAGTIRELTMAKPQPTDDRARSTTRSNPPSARSRPKAAASMR